MTSLFKETYLCICISYHSSTLFQGSFWVWASQWEEALLCNAFSHWPSTYPEWSLSLKHNRLSRITQDIIISISYMVNIMFVPDLATPVKILAYLAQEYSQSHTVRVNGLTHDDVIKWKHFPRYWPFVRGSHRSPVDSPHNRLGRRALMFSLICAWTNGWASNREAGDLRRHHAHYVVNVMLHMRRLLRQ